MAVCFHYTFLIGMEFKVIGANDTVQNKMVRNTFNFN